MYYLTYGSIFTRLSSVKDRFCDAFIVYGRYFCVVITLALA